MRDFVVFDAFKRRTQIMEPHAFVESPEQRWRMGRLWNVIIVAAEAVHQEMGSLP